MPSASLIAGDFADRFRRHLPRSNNLTLIVLKGHLLVEELVNRFVTVLPPSPDALPSDLTCYQRIRLLRALLQQSPFDDILGRIEKLNALRNKFGHNLEPVQIESQIEAFVRLFEEPGTLIPEQQRAPMARRLKSSISFLCGELYGTLQGYVATQAVLRTK